jgi:hypothetical protein
MTVDGFAGEDPRMTLREMEIFVLYSIFLRCWPIMKVL